MSYTPLIFASLSDLQKVDNKTDKLKHWQYYDTDTEKGFAMNEIKNCFHEGASFTIKGIEVVILHAEWSGRNEEIRKTLDKLKVEYATEY